MLDDASYHELYFEWLCLLVYDDCHADEYSNLLAQMYATPFRYLLARDANRESDGRYLRYRFSSERFIDKSELRINEPVSLLEVLVALALRGEESIMRDFDIGDRTPLWFWTMIDSMHLSGQTNENYDPDYVKERCDILMDRRFEPNGDGGLFILDTGTDMRNVEFWYQLNWYFSSLF